MSFMGFKRAAAPLFGVLLLASTAAQAQNGLERFEKDIKPQFDFKSFTYDKGSALGDKGFVLDNTTIVMPGTPATGGKDTTVKIGKITVEDADFERLTATGKSDDVPRFAKLKIENMTGDESIGSLFDSFGVPKAPVDIALDYRLDPAAKVLTLSKLEVALRDQGSLILRLVVDGESDKASEAAGAKDNARLRSAALTYSDAGLLAQLLPAIAKQQGASADGLIAMVAAPLATFASGQGPDTRKAVDALSAFVADWKKPNGPIRISIAPAKGATLADLDKIQQPNALTDIFGLKVDYAGTASASAAAPATDGKALEGAEAWLAIVGNTVTGSIDGDVFFEYYRKDGTLALLEGSEITKGKWSLEGERVCFKYPDEDKDCQTIRLVGDTVTYKRKGKTDLRLEVLPGNPKDL